MKKFGRNILAVGLATLLVTAAVSFSANGADTVVAQSSSSSIKSTGLLGIIDTDSCDATTSTDQDATPTGTCGLGLDFDGVRVTEQSATGTVADNGDGESKAVSSIAPINVQGLGSINLSDLIPALQDVDTGADLIDGLLGGLGDILNGLGLPAVVDALSDALAGPLDTLGGALPVQLEIGAVNAQCTAEPGSADGSSTVADLAVVIDLGPDTPGVRIPFSIPTEPNSPLVGSSETDTDSAVTQIALAVVDGLKATLTESLDGALADLGITLTDALKQQILQPLFDQLQDPLLDPLGDLLGDQLGLVSGTVNKQDISGGKAEITALDLHLGPNDALGSGALATVSCGPNSTFESAVVDDVAAVDDDDAVDDAADDSDAVADADADADADAAADADSAADADVTTSLPNTGANANLLPFWLLGLALVAFGGAVLVNERRRTL